MYSSNPFPDFPSSPNNVFFPPNYLFHLEKYCSSFSYQNINIDPFFSGDCFHDPYNNLAPPSPAIDNNRNTNKQDFGRQLSIEYPGLQTCEEDHDDLLKSVISSCKKKKDEASKTHGHSKIYTAQGPRDRRVRLSIDISRKFFCLQDMLGFDKASKTLDWLFSKCKSAIKELVEETNDNSSSNAAYQSKTSFLEEIIDGGESKKKSKLKDVDGKRKKLIIKKPKGGIQLHNFGREQSRAVARARARERVREKMRIKQLNNELKNTNVHDDFNYQNLKSSAGESHDRVISAYPGAW